MISGKREFCIFVMIAIIAVKNHRICSVGQNYIAFSFAISGLAVIKHSVAHQSGAVFGDYCGAVVKRGIVFRRVIPAFARVNGVAVRNNHSFINNVCHMGSRVVA